MKMEARSLGKFIKCKHEWMKKEFIGDLEFACVDN